MTPITTHWSVYSDSQVPAWLLGLSLLAGIGLLVRWSRGKRCRATWARLLLPWTGSLLLLLILWAAWKPALVAVTQCEQRGTTVLCIDGSASMDVPLANDRLSTQLNLLALWHPEAVAARNSCGE